MANRAHKGRWALIVAAILVTPLALSAAIRPADVGQAERKPAATTESHTSTRRADPPPADPADQKGLVTGTAVRTLYLGTITAIEDDSLTVTTNDGDTLAFAFSPPRNVTESLDGQGITAGSHVAIYSWNDTDPCGALVISSIHIDQ
ncbi:hypothetical protein AAK967_05940 [Atopobiaceae bacterium 24-176]